MIRRPAPRKDRQAPPGFRGPSDVGRAPECVAANEPPSSLRERGCEFPDVRCGDRPPCPPWRMTKLPVINPLSGVSARVSRGAKAPPLKRAKTPSLGEAARARRVVASSLGAGKERTTDGWDPPPRGSLEEVGESRPGGGEARLCRNPTPGRGGSATASPHLGTSARSSGRAGEESILLAAGPAPGARENPRWGSREPLCELGELASWESALAWRGCFRDYLSWAAMGVTPYSVWDYV